jgi:hypothetical protein
MPRKYLRAGKQDNISDGVSATWFMQKSLHFYRLTTNLDEKRQHCAAFCGWRGALGA